jgi:hypothetical protein
MIVAIVGAKVRKLLQMEEGRGKKKKNTRAQTKPHPRPQPHPWPLSEGRGEWLVLKVVDFGFLVG